MAAELDVELHALLALSFHFAMMQFLKNSFLEMKKKNNDERTMQNKIKKTK